MRKPAALLRDGAAAQAASQNAQKGVKEEASDHTHLY
jgi:hypothetical protein